MKKIFNKILIISVVITFSSCDSWLDVVPDNLPTVTDAFSNRETALKSLFTCYSYLPDPTSPFGYPAYFSNRDEFEYGLSPHCFQGYASAISRGEQNTNSPILNYWSGGNGATNMFQAINFCNLFLSEIHRPEDMNSEIERSKWIAEVKFLKAYYHFFMMQIYGPVPLIKENLPLSASPEEVRVFREPIDECVDFIVQLIDEAVPDLPSVIENPVEENGRITQPIALSVKAKVLAWGASPLFNGNTIYRDWRDKRGKQLVSDTYDREKWVRAAEAIREAIEACHATGHQLYRYNKLSSPQTFRMNDTLAITMSTRKAITERWNSGIIWSSMETFGYPKGGLSGGFVSVENMQRILYPVMYAQALGSMIGYCNAAFNMAELFYTKNGIPIDEDVNWNYEDRYSVRTSTPEAGNEMYIALGQQTASLHFDREPRFYANLTFDRGFFEVANTTTDGGVTFSPYVTMRQNDRVWADNNTGYWPKKLAAFETTVTGSSYTSYDYRFPLLRLSDLYLLYSEALNEIKDVPDAQVYEWIDQVRDVAGLKGVVESWQNSSAPNRPSDKNEMRKIIRQERLIELAFEGQRFWDVRRWKMGEELWSSAPRGWYYFGASAEEYYMVVPIAEARKFTFRDYLWPISVQDLRINGNLVQSYGW